MGSIDLRDHRLTPGVAAGMAQLMASFSRPGASGVRLPIQISSTKAPPVASIFMPWMVTPASSTAVTCSDGESNRWPRASELQFLAPAGGCTA